MDQKHTAREISGTSLTYYDETEEAEALMATMEPNQTALVGLQSNQRTIPSPVSRERSAVAGGRRDVVMK